MRFSEGRFFGALHAPLGTRSAAGYRTRSSLRGAARIVREYAATSKSSDALADLGLLQLTLGKADAAVESFRAARDRAPHSAPLAGELVAALLERASHDGRPSDLQEALSTIEDAVAAQPNSPELLFNRALTLERLCLDRPAVEAWQDYLEVDSTSLWADEVRVRLDRLRRMLQRHRGRGLAAELRNVLRLAGKRQFAEIVQRRMRETRLLVEDELLIALIDSYEASDRRTFGDLRVILRHFAGSYHELTGDPFYRDVLIDLEQGLMRGPEQVRSNGVEQGLRQYAAGRRALGSAEYAKAREILSAAHDSLARSGSPFALRALQALATAEHFLGERDRARRRLSVVVGQAGRQGFLTVHADALWMAGLSHFADDQLDAALDSYQAAAALFDRLADRENLMGALNLVSETLDRQGEFEAAWRPRFRALQLSRETRDPLRLYQLWAVAAIGANNDGHPRAALVFQYETVRYARQMRNPLALANALLWRARYRSALRDFDAALADLRQAERAAHAIPDRRTFAGATAAVLLAFAEIQVAEAPGDALSFLDRAEHLSKSAGQTYHLSTIYLLRSRIARARGDFSTALVALERCIELLKYWEIADLGEEATREALELLRRCYDEIATIYLEELGDTFGAFRFVEERRVAEQALARRRPLHAVTLPRRLDAALVRRLRADQVLVSLAPLGNRVLVTAISSSAAMAFPVKVQTSKLTSFIRHFRSLAQESGSTSSLRQMSMTLYRLLFRPIDDLLDGKAELILALDPPLVDLPFPLLQDEAGELLVEKHVLRQVSAATLLLDEGPKARRDFRSVSALFIGASVPDTASFPDLATLPGAEHEVRACAREYTTHQLLVGAEATKRQVLAQIGHHGVIQFSAHAVGGTHRRHWARVILGGRQGSTRATSLSAFEVSHLSLSGNPLVLLATCGSGTGPSESFGSGRALAEGFLAAGATGVVYSLWPLEDGDMTNLLVAYHHILGATGSPVAALAIAQRRAFEAGRNPRIWGGLAMLGESR